MEERLQKIISRAGIASRRKAEQLMLSGQVTVNGRVITELGTRADAQRDHIKVSGKLLHGAEEPCYIALNKPPEVVATLNDPEGRRTLADLLRGAPARLYPVGRLGYHESGLLFLTNDGDLANRLLRSHGVRQTYFVKLKGSVAGAALRDLESAVGAQIVPVRGGENAWYEVSLAGASGNPLCDTLAAKNHPVEKMKRVKIGNLELGALPPGRFRELTAAEVTELRRVLDKSDARREFKLNARGKENRPDERRTNEGRRTDFRGGMDMANKSGRGARGSSGKSGGAARDARGGRSGSAVGAGGKRGARGASRPGAAGGQRKRNAGAGQRDNAPRGPRRQGSGPRSSGLRDSGHLGERMNNERVAKAIYGDKPRGSRGKPGRDARKNQAGGRGGPGDRPRGNQAAGESVAQRELKLSAGQRSVGERVRESRRSAQHETERDAAQFQRRDSK